MGTLYIVPTPIGNLQDITLRALDVLFSVQLIACEDTRKTGQLLKLLKEKYNVTPSVVEQKLISYYDQNEAQRIPEMVSVLKADFDIALVSDAGTPAISDPGFKLIRTCREEKIPVFALPGASSVIVALASSGLPTDKFTFVGYPPHKIGHRKTLFQNILASSKLLSSTYVLFEAPHKLIVTLEELHEALGDIEIVLCRELTKLHEELRKETISEMLAHFSKKVPRGECILLFHL